MFSSVEDYLDWQDRQDRSLAEAEAGWEVDGKLRYYGYEPHPEIPWLYVDSQGNPIDEPTAFKIFDQVIEEEYGEWAQITKKKPDILRLRAFLSMYKAAAAARYGGKNERVSRKDKIKYFCSRRPVRAW